MDWNKIWEEISSKVMEHTPALLAALATFVVGLILAKVIRGATRRVMRRARADEMLTGFVANLTYMALLAFVIIAVLGRLGVATGSFVAVIGAAGLAIGFALQGSLSNFAAGVMIVTLRPFHVGDYVEAGGAAGTVQEIHVFSTMLNTPDNKRVIIPNSQMIGGTITDYSANETRRVDMVFGIGYEDDLRKAKDILTSILAEHPKVLDEPAPAVAVAALADSSVNFNVRPWCKTPDYWGVYSDVTEAVKLRFDEAGISIPFPQRDVHLHRVGDEDAA